MPTLRRTLQRQFDSGLATTLLIASMAVALWFASQHWHERAFTTLGMAALRCSPSPTCVDGAGRLKTNAARARC